MKKEMRLTVGFEDDFVPYAVNFNCDDFDLEAFLGGVASVINMYQDKLTEQNISPADIGYLLTTLILTDGDDENEEF